MSDFTTADKLVRSAPMKKEPEQETRGTCLADEAKSVMSAIEASEFMEWAKIKPIIQARAMNLVTLIRMTKAHRWELAEAEEVVGLLGVCQSRDDLVTAGIPASIEEIIRRLS